MLGHLFPLNRVFSSSSENIFLLIAKAPVMSPTSLSHQTASGATLLSNNAMSFSGNCDGMVEGRTSTPAFLTLELSEVTAVLSITINDESQTLLRWNA